MIVQRRPSGALKVNNIAGKPASGSTIDSLSKLTRECTKNDITEATVRLEYAGCAALLIHATSKVDVNSVRRLDILAVASVIAVLLKHAPQRNCSRDFLPKLHLNTLRRFSKGPLRKVEAGGAALTCCVRQPSWKWTKRLHTISYDFGSSRKPWLLLNS